MGQYTAVWLENIMARKTIVNKRFLYLDKDYCIPDVGKFCIDNR